MSQKIVWNRKCLTWQDCSQVESISSGIAILKRELLFCGKNSTQAHLPNYEITISFENDFKFEFRSAKMYAKIHNTTLLTVLQL